MNPGNIGATSTGFAYSDGRVFSWSRIRSFIKASSVYLLETALVSAMVLWKRGASLALTRETNNNLRTPSRCVSGPLIIFSAAAFPEFPRRRICNYMIPLGPACARDTRALSMMQNAFYISHLSPPSRKFTFEFIAPPGWRPGGELRPIKRFRLLPLFKHRARFT